MAPAKISAYSKHIAGNPAWQSTQKGFGFVGDKVKGAYDFTFGEGGQNYFNEYTPSAAQQIAEGSAYIGHEVARGPHWIANKLERGRFGSDDTFTRVVMPPLSPKNWRVAAGATEGSAALGGQLYPYFAAAPGTIKGAYDFAKMITWKAPETVGHFKEQTGKFVGSDETKRGQAIPEYLLIKASKPKMQAFSLKAGAAPDVHPAVEKTTSWTGSEIPGFWETALRRITVRRNVAQMQDAVAGSSAIQHLAKAIKVGKGQQPENVLHPLSKADRIIREEALAKGDSIVGSRTKPEGGRAPHDWDIDSKKEQAKVSSKREPQAEVDAIKKQGFEDAKESALTNTQLQNLAAELYYAQKSPVNKRGKELDDATHGGNNVALTKVNPELQAGVDFLRQNKAMFKGSVAQIQYIITAKEAGYIDAATAAKLLKEYAPDAIKEGFTYEQWPETLKARDIDAQTATRLNHWSKWLKQNYDTKGFKTEKFNVQTGTGWHPAERAIGNAFDPMTGEFKGRGATLYIEQDPIGIDATPINKANFDLSKTKSKTNEDIGLDVAQEASPIKNLQQLANPSEIHPTEKLTSDAIERINIRRKDPKATTPEESFQSQQKQMQKGIRTLKTMMGLKAIAEKIKLKYTTRGNVASAIELQKKLAEQGIPTTLERKGAGEMMNLVDPVTGDTITQHLGPEYPQLYRDKQSGSEKLPTAEARALQKAEAAATRGKRGFDPLDKDKVDMIEDYQKLHEAAKVAFVQEPHPATKAKIAELMMRANAEMDVFLGRAPGKEVFGTEVGRYARHLIRRGLNTGRQNTNMKPELSLEFTPPKEAIVPLHVDPRRSVHNAKTMQEDLQTQADANHLADTAAYKAAQKEIASVKGELTQTQAEMRLKEAAKKTGFDKELMREGKEPEYPSKYQQTKPYAPYGSYGYSAYATGYPQGYPYNEAGYSQYAKADYPQGYKDYTQYEKGNYPMEVPYKGYTPYTPYPPYTPQPYTPYKPEEYPPYEPYKETPPSKPPKAPPKGDDETRVGYQPVIKSPDGTTRLGEIFKTPEDAALAAMQETLNSPYSKFTVRKVVRPQMKYSPHVRTTANRGFRQTSATSFEKRKSHKKNNTILSLLKD